MRNVGLRGGDGFVHILYFLGRRVSGLLIVFQIEEGERKNGRRQDGISLVDEIHTKEMQNQAS